MINKNIRAHVYHSHYGTAVMHHLTKKTKIEKISGKNVQGLTNRESIPQLARRPGSPGDRKTAHQMPRRCRARRTTARGEERHRSRDRCASSIYKRARAFSMGDARAGSLNFLWATLWNSVGVESHEVRLTDRWRKVSCRTDWDWLETGKIGLGLGDYRVRLEKLDT